MTSIPASASIYVSPHPDDWLLFQGHRAAADLACARHRVVFLYLNAGDAGRTDGWWQAREQAVLAAVAAWLPTAPVIRGRDVIAGHPIATCRQGPALHYFLRLPDGLRDGPGRSGNRPSLTRLRHQHEPLTAVDGSTTYDSWTDLLVTLATLCDRVRIRTRDIHPWIHAPEYREDLNPGDHVDHRAAADAVRSFANRRYHRAWWLTYSSYYHRPNLGASEVSQKSRAFDAYRSALGASAAGTEADLLRLQEEWRVWGDRGHVRETAWAVADEESQDTSRRTWWPERVTPTMRLRDCRPVPVEERNGETVLRHPLSGTVVRLSAGAAVLWDVLEDPCSAEELTALLAAARGQPSVESRLGEVMTLLEDLLRARLLVAVDLVDQRVG